MSDDWLTILPGDCREVLATLPSESINCVVTSPPYWGLRDYGTATWEGGRAHCDHLQVAGIRQDGGPDAGAPSGNGFIGRQGGSRLMPMSGGDGSEERFVPGTGRNIRTVWTIATQPYPGAHFATFPEALVEPCIKAGSSERGVCPVCGASWVRDVVSNGPDKPNQHARHIPPGQSVQNGLRMAQMGSTWTKTTTGWSPSCEHDAEPVPAVVLDPFGGSGTTARVANRLSRRAVLIELNPDYIEQAEARNAQAPLGLGA